MADRWRTAWVTGASSGIGEAVARLLAQQGVTVAISARSGEALARIAAESDNIHAFPLDVTDEDAAAQVIEEIEARLGPVDLGLFCAGTWDIIDTKDLATAPLARGMAVNYLGTVNCLVPLAQRMMKRGSGQLAPVASVAGYRGLPRAAAYGPTKAALISLCESLKPALARYGVTVNVVNPGFVDTPMTAKNDFPMPYLMQPEEAAGKIVAGLKRDGFEVAFPWPLVWQLKALSILPAPVYFYLIRTFVSGRK